MSSEETYIKRRELLKNQVRNGLILLLGNAESPMNYTDNTYHYRQDSSFLYFTGISHPDLIDLWKSKKINTDYLNFDRIEEYRNFGGLRNEEDFLITADGKKLLGKPKPKTVADVEKEREYAFNV